MTGEIEYAPENFGAGEKSYGTVRKWCLSVTSLVTSFNRVSRVSPLHRFHGSLMAFSIMVSDWARWARPARPFREGWGSAYCITVNVCSPPI